MTVTVNVPALVLLGAIWFFKGIGGDLHDPHVVLVVLRVGVGVAHGGHPELGGRRVYPPKLSSSSTSSSSSSSSSSSPSSFGFSPWRHAVLTKLSVVIY